MNKPIHILLVEDNPADADLMQEILSESKLHLEFSLCADGLEAMEWLRTHAAEAGSSGPDLILLDLNLPKKDGREVLAEIKGDSGFRRIPVVVLTSSDAELDIVKSYDLGANCYVKKPLNLAGFETIVRAVESFWFTIVKLPPVSDQ